MSKASAVTQDDINAIAIDFMAQGQIPSINLVQSELKKRHGFAGGTQVVTRMIAAWKENAAKALSQKVRPGIPEELSTISDKLVALAMDHASNLLISETEEIRKSGEEYKAECDVLISQANAETMRLQSQYDLKESHLTVALEKVSSLEATVIDRDAAIHSLSNEMNLFRDQALKSAGVIEQLKDESVQVGIANAGMLAKLSNDHAVEIKDLKLSSAAEIERVEQKYLGLIRQERDAIADDRKRLYLEIDSRRTEMKQQATKDALILESQKREVDAARKMELELRKEAQNLRERNAFLEGSFKSMEAEVEKAREMVHAISSQNAILISKIEAANANANANAENTDLKTNLNKP